MANLLMIWIAIGVTAFLVGCIWRGARYARAPVHLRWDLYPVAHEPRRGHGGSYLEEKDWWTKPRTKSLYGEVAAMAEEILFLKGVWESNRVVWVGSLPFHWGLYLLMITTFALLPFLVGMELPALLVPLGIVATVGSLLLAVGAAALVVIRSTLPRLRFYTTALDRLNLVLLLAFGVLSALVALAPRGMEAVVEALRAMIRFQAPEVAPVLAAQMAVGALFVLYMPFTRMIHFFAKYFMYHEVRWDDEPMKAGSRMERRIKVALGYGLAWSADHIQTGRSWGEVATTSMPEPTEGGTKR